MRSPYPLTGITIPLADAARFDSGYPSVLKPITRDATKRSIVEIIVWCRSSIPEP
jgi:hypothetical protein